MKRWMLLAATLLVASYGLSGCVGSGEAKGSGSQSPSGGGVTASGNATASASANTSMQLTVTITDAPTSVNFGDMVNISWSVETESNETVTLTHTGVHYGNMSADPSGGNTTGNATGDPYPNSAGETDVATAPGEFNASFEANESGSIYLRAHAMVGSKEIWSDEVVITVGPGGEAQTVTITNGLLPQLASFNPRDVKIKVGDSVIWKNEDDAMHNATGNDGSWTSGDIAGGKTSEPVRFETAGTFAYRCTVHPQFMTGQVTVE